MDAARVLLFTYHFLRARENATFWLSKITDHLGFIGAIILLLYLLKYIHCPQPTPQLPEATSKDWELVKTTTKILRRVAQDYDGASASQAVTVIEHLGNSGKENWKDGLITKLSIPFFGSVGVPAKAVSSDVRGFHHLTMSRRSSPTSAGVDLDSSGMEVDLDQPWESPGGWSI